MNLSVYVANLAAYNSGILRGAWITLPVPTAKIDDLLENIGCKNAEYAIHDYSSDDFNLKVSEYENIFKLNELVEKLDDMDENDVHKVFAYYQTRKEDLEEAIETVEQGDCTLYDGSLEELARALVENGEYGIVPKELEMYIDYESIAHDLNCNGYTESDYGVFYCA